MARILVIDDEEDILFIVKIILESVGHEVATARSGEEGLEILRDIDPDLILLDVMMPGIDGWGTLRRIRHRPGFEETPVAMITAKPLKSETTMIPEFEELVDYIEKPFTREDLIKKVNYNIIEDLDRINRKRTDLSAFLEERALNDYTNYARREVLHRNVLTALRRRHEKALVSTEEGEIKRAIDSVENALNSYKTQLEDLEEGIGQTESAPLF